MSEIFVSYERSAASQAKTVASALRALGYDVWIDEDLPAHRAYRHVIKEQVRAAKAVVVIWSADAAESDWVPSEATVAREAHKLVQLTIDNAQLPMPFDQIHCVDMRGWTGDLTSPGWRKVVASLAELTGGPQSSLAHNPQTKPLPLRRNSICVLPFVNMSGDAEQEYFSDGISEDIITDLSKIPALFVIARNTAFTFKAMSVDVVEVARKLNVSHVLEGSVRKSGGRVRITAQLIDGATGGHVWADRYDRDLNDIFAVQDEVAAKVADALRVKLDNAGPIPGATTKNVDAYTALLRGRALTTYTNDQSVRAAIEYFKRAIAVDPDYGAAYGELSIAYALMVVFMPLSDIAADWSAAITRALEINPRDASALAAKAYYLTLTEWDWGRAGELYQQARDVGISSKASILYGQMYLAPLGRWSELREFYAATLDSDPYNFDILWDLAGWSSPREALALWDRLLEAQPDLADAWAGKADAYVALADNDAARAALTRADVKRMQPYAWATYVHALWGMGEHEAAQRLVAELEHQAPQGQHAALAWCYAAMEEVDKCLAGYEAAYPQSPFALLFLRGPWNAFLHGQPRYQALLKKVHLDDQSLHDAGLL